MQTTRTLFSEQLHELIAQTTRNLTRVQRTKFETLITIHVHQHDIFEELVSSSKRPNQEILVSDWLITSHVTYIKGVRK